MMALLLAFLLLQVNPAPTGVATGLVLSASGAPAPGVRVYAIPAGDPNGAAANAGTVFASLAQTDAAGRYRLEIPAGRYYIAAGSVDSPTYYPNEPNIAAAKVVTITVGASVDGVNFSRYVPASSAPGPLRTIAPLSPLSGVLRYSDGTPAAGITVVAVSTLTLVISSQTNTFGTPQATSGVGVIRAVTDNAGQYRIENVPPGTYYIIAGYAESPTFYPGTSDIKAATSTTTTPPMMPSALDFTIPATLATKGTTIRIRVSGAAGRPAGGSTLELSSLAPDLATMALFLPRRATKQAMTGGDGSAELTGVLPGSYSVGARLPPAVSLSKKIDIKDQPVDLDFTFPVNVLTGRVLWEDGSPFFDPVLNQVALSTTSAPGLIATTIYRISSGGFFSGVLEPDDYRVFIRNVPQGYQIRSITWGPRDLTKEKLKFAGDVPVDIEIRVAKNVNPAQKVVGRIVDAVTGMPTAADVVQLCCLSSGPVERMSTALHSDGSFEFSGVPEGHYDMEIRAKTPVAIVNSSIEIGPQGKSGIRLVSAEQFVTVQIGISLDGNDQKPTGFKAAVTLIPASGETFRVTTSGPAEKLLSASVPAGIPYDVFLSDLPPGFKVKDLSGPNPQIGSPGVAPPANSPPGYAGVYNAFYNSSIVITLTRSE